MYECSDNPNQHRTDGNNNPPRSMTKSTTGTSRGQSDIV